MEGYEKVGEVERIVSKSERKGDGEGKNGSFSRKDDASPTASTRATTTSIAGSPEMVGLSFSSGASSRVL